MEIHHLKYVITVAQEKSFTRASKILFISQSALSQQIQLIEKEIGFPLFIRNNKNVVLTELGREFVDRADSIIKQFDAMQQWVIHASNHQTMTISYGANHINMYNTPAFIPSFMQQFPNVHLEYVEKKNHHLLEDIRAGKLDFALVSLLAEEANSDFEVISPIVTPVCAVVEDTHPLSRQKEIDLRDLANDKLFMPTPHSNLYKKIMQQFNSLGIKPSFTFDDVSLTARIYTVLQGFTTFITKNQFDSCSKPNNILAIPLTPALYITNALIYKAGKTLSVPEREFINGLKNVLISAVDNESVGS